MDNVFIFMYRYWGIALFFGILATTVLSWVGDEDSYLCFLPFVLIVTLYFVSMVIVRKYYRRTDEVRYRAHYLRGGFFLLTLISWFLWLLLFLFADNL